MKKALLACLLSGFLAACIQSPIRPDSQLTWTDVTVAHPMVDLFRSVLERQRRCGFVAVQVIAFGPWLLDADEQVLDLSVGGNGSIFRFGRMRMRPVAGGTLVRVGTPEGALVDFTPKIKAVLLNPDSACA